MTIATIVLGNVAVLAALAAPAFSQSTCPAANPNDLVSDDAAINTCLNAGGTVTLIDGSPGYIVEAGLVLQVSGTVLQGTAGTQPKLVAHPNLAAPMLRMPQAIWPSNWTVRNLSFDGGRTYRNAALCLGSYQDRTRGYNLQLKGSSWLIEGVASNNTLCGSAMEVEGSYYTIRNNTILASGYPYNVAPNPYAVADGITIAHCNGGLVQGNTIADSTDVNLIVGGGSGCVVENNSITQTVQGQVGLMIGFAGDHSGSIVRTNQVNATLGKLPVGLLVGDHAHDLNLTTMTHAGTIDGNFISGATVLGAIDGIAAGTVSNNIPGTADPGPFPLPNCAPGVVYTAGDFGAAWLQPGWVPRTYHFGSCQ